MRGFGGVGLPANRGRASRRSPSAAAVAFTVFGVLLASCGTDEGSSDATPTIVTRGQDFAEARTLVKVYALHLESLGYPVDILTAAGFRVEAITALEAGEINLIVDYIGGAQAEILRDIVPSPDPDVVMSTIRPEFARRGATVLDYTPAVDGDALIVRGDSPATTISDLAGLDIVFGASAQCFERPQCFVGLTDPAVYGLEFAATRTIEFGPLLGEALRAGAVDAIVWNDTAPQIDIEGFRILVDDRGLFPAQNIAPILRDELVAAYGEELTAAIDALSALITTEDLVAWNVQTDIEFREPIDVAREWLTDRGLLR